ncbi:hypothetical protein BASA82_000318 [Batrachochytrium salamandrivorans]|nr:hypothetical protein BASA81_002784 [Batrachochytrium salamandrivorans]KAH9262649.1 hypothetical protein BASA82_000318 [Batrachochytrium salamandrivorans]
MEYLVNVASASASFVGADTSRKSRVDRVRWREAELRFRADQTKYFEIQLLQRQQDLQWRKEELLYLDLNFIRVQMNERNEMLRNISNISSLMAGFTLMILVDMGVDTATTPEWLSSLYAVFSSLTICLMTYALVSCTLIIIAILKKFQVADLELGEDALLQLDLNVLAEMSFERRQKFQRFWETMCEGDFYFAFAAFSLGVPLFLVSTVFATWVKFAESQTGGILVSIICGSMVLFLFWTLQMKWTVWTVGIKPVAPNTNSAPAPTT